MDTPTKSMQFIKKFLETKEVLNCIFMFQYMMSNNKFSNSSLHVYYDSIVWKCHIALVTSCVITSCSCATVDQYCFIESVIGCVWFSASSQEWFIEFNNISNQSSLIYLMKQTLFILLNLIENRTNIKLMLQRVQVYDDNVMKKTFLFIQNL